VFVALHGEDSRSDSGVVWVPLGPTGTQAPEVVFGGGRSGAPRVGSWSWRVGPAFDSPVRPSALAVSPLDGALYVASEGGAVYRIAELGH